LLIGSALACGCHITNYAEKAGVNLGSIGNSDLCHTFADGGMDRVSGHLKSLIMARATRGIGLAAVYLFATKVHWIAGCPLPIIGLD
jgi:hypothetical protein